jgi:hypothetical protein
MSFITKTRNTFVIFVLLLISFVRTSLGRNKPLPVSHADVPGATQGLLLRHASGPAYSLEAAKKFPFLRFVKDAVPVATPSFAASGQAVDNRNRARISDPAGRILLFGGRAASLRRQYALEFGGTFPYLRLSPAATGRVGAALEFTPLRTPASADLRAYSLSIGPSPSILQHGALPESADTSSSCTCTSCSCTGCSSCTECGGCSCASCTECSCDCSSCGGCGGCGSCCCSSCSCCWSCACSSCSGFCC